MAYETTQGNLAVSPYQKTIPPEKLEKPGLLKRFLDWIAKGADKSNVGKASRQTLVPLVDAAFGVFEFNANRCRMIAKSNRAYPYNLMDF